MSIDRHPAIGRLMGIAIFATATMCAQISSAQSLISHYTFDDFSLIDSSGNGHDGKISNALPTFGVRRGGLLTLSSGSRAVVPYSPDLIPDHGFSTSGWVYPLYTPNRRETPRLGPIELSSGLLVQRRIIDAIISGQIARERGGEIAVGTRGTSALVRLVNRENQVELVGDSKQSFRFLSLDPPISTERVRHAFDLLRQNGIQVTAIAKLEDCVGCQLIVPGLYIEPVGNFQNPMPSVMAIPGSYGLDVDPKSGRPYAIANLSGQNFKVVADKAVKAHAWNHIGATYNGEFLSIYLDGNVAGTTPVPRLDNGAFRSVVDTRAPMFIGEYPFDRGASAGVIDEVKLYSGALSSAQMMREFERNISFASFPFAYGKSFDHSTYAHTSRGMDVLASCDSSIQSPGKGGVLSLLGENSSFAFSSRREAEIWGSATLEETNKPERYSGSVTVQLWVKLANLPSGIPKTIVSQGSGSDSPFALRVWPNGRVEWRVLPKPFGGSGSLRRLSVLANFARSRPVLLLSKKSVDAGAWVHLAGTFDQQSGVSRLFVDGIQVAGAKTALAGQLDIDWTGTFYVGGPPGYSPEASVDEVEIFKFARSTQEIEQDSRYFEQSCDRRPSGNFRDLSQQLDNVNQMMDDLLQSMQNELSGSVTGGDPGPFAIDCRYAYCDENQLAAWQAGSQSPSPLTGSLGASPNVDCTVAICDEDQIQVWLASQQSLQSFAETMVSPFVDCTVAICDDAQWLQFQTQTYRSVTERVSQQIAEARQQGHDNCGPMMCCVASVADTDGSSEASGTAEGGGDIDADDLETDGGAVHPDGTVTAENVRFRDTGKKLDGEYNVVDGDGDTGKMYCDAGSCVLVPDGNGADATGVGGGSSGTSGNNAPGGNSNNGGNNPTPSGNTNSGTDGTGGNNASADSPIDLTDATLNGFDADADVNRSSWDEWNSQSFEPQSEGESVGGTGLGRYTTKATDVGSILGNPAGMGSIDLTGSNSAILTDENWLVPVSSVQDGLIVNGDVNGLLGSNGLSLDDLAGSGPPVPPSPWSSNTLEGQDFRTLLNRGMGALAAGGPNDTRSEGLSGLIRTYLDFLLTEKPGWSAEDIAKANDLGNSALDILLGFIPFAGDGQDVWQVVHGKNLTTGEALSTTEFVASAAGIIVGSGGLWKTVLGETFDDAARWGKHFTQSELDEIAEIGAEQVDLASKLDGDVKFRALTEKQLETEWAQYQMRAANNDVPIEYQANLKYEVPHKYGMTVQVDGIRASPRDPSKVDIIEAKYTKPGQPFNYSFHNGKGPIAPNRKYGTQADQVFRYRELANDTENIDRFIIRCNTPELAEYYQGIVDSYAATGKDMSMVVVEYFP